MKLRTKFLVCFLTAAICLLLPPVGTGDARTTKTPFGTGADAGSGLLKYRDACVAVRVLFISGDFFKELHQRKTLNGVEFSGKKQKTIYVNFPDQLVVDLEAIAFRCGGKPAEVLLPNGSEQEMSPPEYTVGLMAKPSFELAWKRGDEKRPVALGATQEYHYPAGMRWSYVLNVPSAAVPLTESLEIDMSLRSGACRLHMTANLDRRVSRLVHSTCD